MLDDIRDHDAKPTSEEEAWMGTDAVGLIVRAVALAGLALAVGVLASTVVDPALSPQPAIAAVSR